MPTFITGLPVHVLVVHAVVVLVPLSAVGALVVAAWPRARRRWGWPVVVAAALAVIAVPIATSSGEGLEHNLPRTAAIEAHTHLGDELLPFAGGMLIALVALVLVQRRVPAPRTDGPGTMTGPRLARGPARVLTIVLAVLTAALAVVSLVQVVRIGDSGARAAWGSVQYVPQAGGGEQD
jgi:preprotein translocase subunit SecG